MTEERTRPDDHREPASPEVVREIREAIFPFDPSLESLVMLVNLMDSAEVGVTLHLKGAVVSGMLISVRRFFKLLSAELQAGIEANPHAANTARTFADLYGPTLDELEKARDEYNESEKLPSRPHHIHMRHVSTYLSFAQPITQKLWRGRLTEVDGWSIGNFGDRAPELPEELS